MSDEVHDFVQGEGERLADHLRVTAPHVSGTYSESFKVTTGTDIRYQDRRAAFVINTAGYATVLEVGAAWMQNPPMPMTRVLDAFKDD
jgi:hypothetical protein